VLREGFADGTSEGEGGAVELARTLQQDGDLEGAEAVLREAWEATPDIPAIADALESVLLELGRADSAASLLRERLDRETDPHLQGKIAVRAAEVLLDRLARPGDAVEVLRDWARPERCGRAEILFTRALEAAGDDSELEGWLEFHEEAIEGPRRIETLLELARLQEKGGRLRPAIATLWRAEREAPIERRPTVRASLRALLASHGEPEDRLALIDLLLADTDEAPARARIRVDRARLLAEHLGRTDEACQELERARAEAPLPPSALRRLADLYHTTGRPDAELRCLRELAGIVPNASDQRRVTLRMSELLVRGPAEVRDPEAAEPLLFDLLQRTPDDAETTRLLIDALDESGRHEKLAALLEERLSTELEPDERRALTLRLAALLSPDAAAARLRELRTELGPHPASDRALADALRGAGDPLGEAELARACTRESSSASPVRNRWIVRWLDALERSGAPPEEQLERVTELLEELPNESLLLRAQLRFLRQGGSESALAESLERALEGPDVLAEGERRQALRELVFLWDGPLENPGRALTRLESELPNDPSLALLLSRLAARSSDPERLIRALEPLVLEPPDGFEPSPQDVRRLALALWEAGRVGEAEPLLRQAVSHYVDDLEVVRTLDAIARTGKDRNERLRWLEARFSLESLGSRASIARESFELCETERDEDRALRWVRRWEELSPLEPALALRWIDLERERGDRTSEIDALRAVDERIEDAGLRSRLLARRATLHEEAGEWELARVARGEAVRICPSPDVDLLRAWEVSLRHPDRMRDRAEALARLAAHSSLSPEDRTGYTAERADLLAQDPALREEAALEFRALFDAAGDGSDERRVEWGRRLLDLYRSLGLDHDWCTIAGAIVPSVPAQERPDLLRALARELDGALGARDSAIRRWHELLDLVPDDREALEALVGLLGAAGHEARRAAVLERLAESAGVDAPSRLIEAARIRWRVLGDASWALADLERAIEERPDSLEAHELRLEVCAHLAQPEEEAQSLRALLKREGDRPVAAERWLRLAQVLVGLPDTTAEVRTAAERALTLSPANPQLRAGVRRVLERVGDWDRVADLLREEAAEAEPALAAARVRRLARVEWLDRHDPALACEAFEALSVLDTLTSEDRALYADVLSNLGRWPEALEVRADALRILGPTAPPEAWLDLATARLERLGDPQAARSACDTALDRDPGCVEALRLRADLDARLEDYASELEYRELLGERLSDPVEGAAELARAGTIAREHLSDSGRSQVLFTRALELDSCCVPALLGIGELSFQVGEFEEAERHLARASSRLADSHYSAARAEVARLAARAAAHLGRDDDALAHIEISLDERPDDPATLELAGTFALRASAWDRAREVLVARLARDDLDPSARVEALAQLAQAREALGDLGGSAEALEEATTLRPEAAALRATLIDLLERLGDPVRAVAQLDAWSERLPPEDRCDLALRAARIELRNGRTGPGRDRLDRILNENPAEADAWRELLPLVLEQDGPEGALERTSEALSHVVAELERAPVLIVRALALEGLGRNHEAAEAALTALEADPGSEAAAGCLAAHVGRTGEWQRAARALERTLQVAHPLPTMEATLWEAVGRMYAGPLEDLDRAERAYRRALSCNPDHDRAREALADVTSFQPEAHAESLRLHLVLLAKFPGRRASWRALERIAAHAKSDDTRAVCRWVLCALDGERERDEATRGARELFSRMALSAEVGATLSRLRRGTSEQGTEDGIEAQGLAVAEPIQRVLVDLVGSAWVLDDDDLRVRLNGLARRGRSRGGAQREEAELAVEAWRAEVLAVAAARAAGLGLMDLREAIEALLAANPESAGLDLRAQGDVAEAAQLCPAASQLLLHIAESLASTILPA
jgi:lipopolysaccharide biosynthesis regulator YciM